VAPGQLPYPLPELVLLNVCHRHWPALGGAVLANQTAGTALGSPKSILQNYDSSSHREVRFAAQRRSGLRSFPSHRKVRLTAQRAPTASPGLRLAHGLVELCLSE
jgi:hypothetical protein